VYRDPLASLKQTLNIFNDFPGLAVKVKRMWLHDFYTAETNRLIADLLRNCKQLAFLSIPWTTIRYLDSKTWQTVILGQDRSLESLEFQCVEPMLQQVAERGNHINIDPLQSLDFSRLRRFKISGDTTFMPITDNDLFVVARTANQLEELHITCTSHITIRGVMAVANASRNTLRVLEHSLRSHRDCRGLQPRSSSHSEHLCNTLSAYPRLQTLSITLPSVCADLFARENVRFRGDLQVHAQHVCGYEGSPTTPSAINALRALLQAARGPVRWSAGSCALRDVWVEIFLGEYIFEPVLSFVHGEFARARASSNGVWPTTATSSGKGPNASIGTDDKDEPRPFHRIDEDDFLTGVQQGLYSGSSKELKSEMHGQTTSISAAVPVQGL
jgi:hypothetical protein